MKLLPVFGIGILRIVQSSANKKVSTYTNTFEHTLRFGVLFETAAAILSLAYLSVAGVGGATISTMICAALTGFGFLCELLTALEALRRAPLVLCSLCSLGGGIILPSIVGIYFFNEPLTLLQWFGVLLFFVSAWLLSPRSEQTNTFSLKTSLPFLLSNFLINGALALIGKYYAVRVPNNNPALFSCWSYATAAVLFGLFLLLKTPKKAASSTTRFPKKVYLFSILLGATCATIVFSSTLLSRTVSIVILNTVPNAICIVGSLLVGFFLFREKITPIRMVGAVLSILSTFFVIASSGMVA